MRGIGLQASGDRQWEYRFDLGADPLTGRAAPHDQDRVRHQEEASAGAANGHGCSRTGASSSRGPGAASSDFLDEWHQAIRPSVRPSTWVNYRNYLDAYVIPVIGGTALQDLTAHAPQPALLPPAQQRPSPRHRAVSHRRPCRTSTGCCTELCGTPLGGTCLPRNVAEDAVPPEGLGAAAVDLGARAARCTSSSTCRRPLLRAVAAGGHDRPPSRRAGGSAERRHRLRPRTVSPRAPGRRGRSSRSVRDQDLERAHHRARPDDPRALRSTSSRLDAERTMLGQDTRLLFVWPTATAPPRHDHRAVPRTLRGGRPTPHPAPRRAALLRHRSTEGGHSAEDHQRAPRSRSAAFTLQTYAHVIPGMDGEAASRQPN